MKRTDNFSKFATKKKNSAVKEEFRQEKKKWKKERSEAIEKKKAEHRKTIEIAKEKGYSPIPESAGKKPIVVRKQDKSMPLNKFVAHCGICSRRDAVLVIKDGKIKVNNEVITEPGHKIAPEDVVSFSGKRIFPENNLVYILLNKPKDYITTLEDPQGRKTVLDLIKGATTERLYPVGRLDRNTTGVLLLTNDGELTQKLSHPSHEVRKVYEAKLDKPLTKVDFDKMLSGLNLEDGFVKADALGYVDSKDKSIVGVEIHSGRNRIVRRMFECLGYDVKGLDRVMFGNLTKKNVERSKWRFLNEKEIRLLKFMNSSFVKKDKEKWDAEISDDDDQVPSYKSRSTSPKAAVRSLKLGAKKTEKRDSSHKSRVTSHEEKGNWRNGETEKRGNGETKTRKSTIENRKSIIGNRQTTFENRSSKIDNRKSTFENRSSIIDPQQSKLVKWEAKIGGENSSRESQVTGHKSQVRGAKLHVEKGSTGGDKASFKKPKMEMEGRRREDAGPKKYIMRSRKK